jgi:hypothetical protein
MIMTMENVQSLTRHAARRADREAHAARANRASARSRAQRDELEREYGDHLGREGGRAIAQMLAHAGRRA